MSDVIKLNIKSKNLRAVITDKMETSDTFTELPEVLEREKQEHAHKVELQNEYNKGLSQGIKETKEALELKHSDELLSQSKDFYNIIATFENKLKDYENSYNGIVISVAQKIAEKVLQKELEESSIIEGLLDQNLRKIIGSNDIVIKLNPKDNEIIQKSSKEYLASTGITKIRFESNENIKVGGCFIESEIGNLDARIETQIAEIVNALENHFTKSEIE